MADTETTTRGRPSLYDPDTMNEQVAKLCQLGAKDNEIADFFGVTERTVNRWKEDHPDFCLAIKEGKRQADANVASSLYHRALGYTHAEEKIFTHEGSIIRAETLKHYPPDTTAAIFWLKNRRAEDWQDRKEIAHSVTLTDDQLDARLAALSKQAGVVIDGEYDVVVQHEEPEMLECDHNTAPQDGAKDT
jgi:hypothetical protein